MKSYIEIGSVPTAEYCQQVGTSEFNRRKETLELQAFKGQLQRLFPKGDFFIKSFNHDFGTYREICIRYDENNEEEVDYAFDVESNCLEKWDEEAIKFLEENNYFGEEN